MVRLERLGGSIPVLVDLVVGEGNAFGPYLIAGIVDGTGQLALREQLADLGCTRGFGQAPTLFDERANLLCDDLGRLPAGRRRVLHELSPRQVDRADPLEAQRRWCIVDSTEWVDVESRRERTLGRRLVVVTVRQMHVVSRHQRKADRSSATRARARRRTSVLS